MSKKISASGKLDSVGQVLGCLNKAGSKKIHFKLSTFQLLPTTPTPKFKLEIYTNNTGYKNNGIPNNDGTIGNLNTMKCVDKIAIKCGEDYNNTITINEQYATFLIYDINTYGSPESNLSYEFHAELSNISMENYTYRDSKLELNEQALVVRNVSDYKTEVMAGQQRGISYWNMNCKGELTNTESLLYDGSYISSMGYFDTNQELHKDNTIIVKSDSSHDTIGGMGAEKIIINGLDNVFDEFEETINLNGLTEVNSTFVFREINYARVIKSGSLFCNAGNITIYNGDVNGGTLTNPQNSICMNHGKSSNPQFCVPRGYELHIQKIHIHNHCEDDSELNINKYEWIEQIAGIPSNINKNVLKTMHLFGNTSTECSVNLKIKQQERITITSQTSVAPTGINRVSVNLSGYLKLIRLNKASHLTKDLGINYVEGYDTLPQDLPTDY